MDCELSYVGVGEGSSQRAGGLAWGHIPETALALMHEVHVQLRAEKGLAICKGNDGIAVNFVVCHTIADCIPLQSWCCVCTPLVQCVHCMCVACILACAFHMNVGRFEVAL